MRELRHNTAVIVPVGTVVSTSNGYTAVTTLVLGSTADVAFIQKYNTTATVSVTTNTFSHVSSGGYALTFTAGNVDTKGPLRLQIIDESLVCPVWCDYEVVTTSFWDSKYAGDNLHVDVKEIEAADPTDTIRDSVVDDATRIDATALNTQTGTALLSLGNVNVNAGVVQSNVVQWDTQVVQRLSTSIADAVWDEPLTGNSHNTATSAGRRLRQVEEAVVHASGIIAAVGGGHTVTLDAGAVAVADYYIGDRLDITEGTGAGQSRLIVAYTSGKVCTLDSDFTTNPNTASLYDVVAADVHVSLSDADLAAGFIATYTNLTTVTLDSAAVATTNYYRDMMLILTHGTGAGQSRRITGYTSGRVCTLSPALTVALDTNTTWHIAAMNDLSTTYVRTAMTNQGYTVAKATTYPASGTMLTSLSNVTVSGWTAAALAALVTTDSTKTSADLHASSVIKLAQGDAAGITPQTVWEYSSGRTLSSGGLDNISTSPPTSRGNTTTIADYIVALFMREYNKNAINVSDNTWKTYANNSTTVVYTQTTSDDGTTASYTKAT